MFIEKRKIVNNFKKERETVLVVEKGLSDFGVKYREGGDIPYHTSTTTSRALFGSRTTVNLLLILLFLLFLPVTKDWGGHGTEAAMCLETWLGC